MKTNQMNLQNTKYMKEILLLSVVSHVDVKFYANGRIISNDCKTN